MLLAARLKVYSACYYLNTRIVSSHLYLDCRLLILPLRGLSVATYNSGIQKFIIVCQHVGCLLLLLRAAFKGLAVLQFCVSSWATIVRSSMQRVKCVNKSYTCFCYWQLHSELNCRIAYSYSKLLVECEAFHHIQGPGLCRFLQFFHMYK